MPTMNNQLNRLLVLKQQRDAASRNFNKACREAFQEGAHVMVLFDTGLRKAFTVVDVERDRAWLTCDIDGVRQPAVTYTFAWLATHNAGTW